MLVELSRCASRQANLSGDFDPHGYEFLGCGWMNADGFVELSLGRAAIERDGQPLDDLASISAHHMATEHPIAQTIDHQLHHGSLVAAAKCMSKRLEKASIDVHVVAGLSRLVFGETDRGAIGRAPTPVTARPERPQPASPLPAGSGQPDL